MNNILVVIPMFGKEEYTRKCIEMTIERAGVPIDILVVDDGSPKEFHYLGGLNDECRVITTRIEKNSGFTNAANHGILKALGMPWVRYIHLLNNDTEPEQDFIKHLYEVMEDDENLSMATSVRLHPKDGSYECELYGIDLLRGFQSVTKLEHLKDEVIQCNWAPLCSSLIRVSAVKYLGLLDKRMRNHSSDLDYCIRAKMNGFNHVIVTRSRVIHHHEITTRSVGASPENDQRVLLEKLAGLYYAQFMAKIPLDAENLTFGKLEFSVYKK